MAKQFSTSLRNALLDLIESHIGASAVLKLFTGAAPANCAAANSGTELWSETVPSDWMAAASGGSKAFLGPWQANGIATGTAAHYRLYASDGTTCHEQGTVTATGGGGDLTLDNTSIASGQSVTISGWTYTAPGA